MAGRHKESGDQTRKLIDLNELKNSRPREAEHAKKNPQKVAQGGTKLGTIVGANLAPNFSVLKIRCLHATQIDFVEA